MSPLAQLDQLLGQIIAEMARRSAGPDWGEFDRVWDLANKVCDRYGLPR
jgi:hypothetical protein